MWEMWKLHILHINVKQIQKTKTNMIQTDNSVVIVIIIFPSYRKGWSLVG